MLIRKLKNDALLEIQYLNTEKKNVIKNGIGPCFIHQRTYTYVIWLIIDV